MKDSVETKTKQLDNENVERELKSLDISDLSLDDFRPLQQKHAALPFPFDGYPVKMLRVGSFMRKGKKIPLMMPAHSIVALNPKEDVFEDPSGRNVSIMDQKTGKERRQNVFAPHNRIVVDYEEGGINTDIVFDRKIPLGSGQVAERCAFIKSHTARAQVLFYTHQDGTKIMVDKRYLLLDMDQVSRLRKVYEMLLNPKIHKERLAKSISNETDEDIGDIPQNE